MTSHNLTKFKETYKAEGIILPGIQRHVMRNADRHDRSDDKLHPSEMCKPAWCGRSDYYRILGTPRDKEKVTSPSFQMSNVFDEGNRIHRKYQTWLWEMGVLWGTFQCKTCGYRWEATAPSQCANCNSERLLYAEIPLVNEPYMIWGHADGAILAPGLDMEDDVLLEVKSIGHRTLAFEAPHLWNQYEGGEALDTIWRNINHPFPSHLRQATLYCWLARPMFQKMVFIYECKWNQQVKEFVVTPNYDHIKGLLAVARDVSYAVRTGTDPPDRPDWAAVDHTTCTGCPYRSTCWSTSVTRPAAPTPTVLKANPRTRRRSLKQAGL